MATLPANVASLSATGAPPVTFAQITIAGVPTGFQPGDHPWTQSTSYNLHGIVWDNGASGYIWGDSGIYNTANGGQARAHTRARAPTIKTK